MASSKMVSRLSSRIQPLLLKLNNKKTSSSFSTSPNNTSSIFNSTFPSQASASSTQNCISRLPVELSSLLTMMPLHSAIASTRLQSNLSIESQSWGLIPQAGHLVRLERVCILHTHAEASRCLYDGKSLAISQSRFSTE